jgi:hypothetical protein
MRLIAVVTATMGCIPEGSLGTISVMCITNMLPTTMEPHFYLWKAQGSKEKTKVFEAENWRNGRSKEDLKKRKNTRGGSS